jgi:membrane peptidoglycan carboxypeptidase
VSVAQASDRNGQQVAGKTGTSDNNKSAWFTGYTPNLVTSVGLFGEAPKDRKDSAGKTVKQGAQVSLKGAAGGGRVNGGGFPAQIWAAYTFNAMGGVTAFDLNTTQGAAMEPTPSDTPSRTPSETPSETPTTQKPTTRPPTSSSPPTETSQSPVAPTTTPPLTPSQTPTGGSSTGPFEPDDQQQQ